MAKESLFRKKSTERIASPEQMRNYLRVTSPKLWMLLSTIILLLAGFIIYAAVSRMESTYPLKMEFFSWEYITGEIPFDQMDHFSVGMPVRIAGETGSIRNVFSSARILLDISPDSSADFEDGLYYMSFGEDTDVSLEDLHYIRYGNGLWTCTELSIQQQLENRDTRVRIWDAKDENLTEGRLATVSNAEPYVIAEVDAILDDAETSLGHGIYDAEIVTENTTPISFLLN